MVGKLYGVGVGVLAWGIHSIWEMNKKKNKKILEDFLEEWNLTIFFPPPAPLPEERSTLSTPKIKFINCLKRAKQKILVCVMTINFKEIVDVLIEKKREGVLVQVYTARSTGDRKCETLLKLNGIEVRSKYYSYSTTMHHKFIIIDDIAVMTGSLNWTFVSFDRQQENIIVTSHARTVEKFCQEFTRRWRVYDP